MVFSSRILMEEIKLCKDKDFWPFWPTDKIANNTLEQQRCNTNSKLSKGIINKFIFKHLGANIDKTIFAQSDLIPASFESCFGYDCQNSFSKLLFTVINIS